MNPRYRLAPVIAILAICISTTCPAQMTLLASYSLDNTAADATGNYGDIDLVNAPYEDGGIYLNGIYQDCSATTPAISGLTTNSFTITLEFRISDFPTLNPVIIGSSSWRWIGAMIDWNEEIQLIYNSTRSHTSNTTVTIDEWHTLMIAYEETAGALYLDDQLVLTMEYDINDGGDLRICTTHGGSGVTFKGHLRNLNIYNGVAEYVRNPTSSVGAIKTKFHQ